MPSDAPRPITPEEREAAGLPAEEVKAAPVEPPQGEPIDLPNMMNQAEIEHPDGSRIPITDLLVNMYLRQISHREEYEKIYRAKGLDPVPMGLWGSLSNPRVQLELRTTAAYMMEELFEAINLLKNKPWKQDMRETNPDEFYEEIADFWHFFLEFLIIAGMTPDLIQKHYFGKADTNDERRATGY